MSLSLRSRWPRLAGGAETLRRLSVVRDLTQAEIVERSEGTTGVDQFVRIERVKWPLRLKPCTAMAKAMDRVAAGQAPLLLLPLINRALERRKPIPHRASIDLRRQAIEAFLTAHRPGKLRAWPGTLNAMAALSPPVKARRAHSSTQRRTAPEVSTFSPPTMHD